MICCECHRIIHGPDVAQRIRKPTEVTLYLCRDCHTRMMEELEADFIRQDHRDHQTQAQLGLW
jgi:RNase P subunit RPR2